MIRSLLARPLAAYIVGQQQRWIKQSSQIQRQTLQSLLQKAQHTQFGKDHGFADIKDHRDFCQQVPLRDYEALRPYMERLVAGAADVLWPGRPAYFAKTSGTTSGTKYIPLTRDSLPNHIGSARDALLCYVHQSGNARFLDRNLMFLSGSPVLSDTHGIPTGRLSGIVNHHIPAYLRSNQRPSYPTNCIDDWEQKLDRVVEETLTSDMSLISGIPPWVQMYFDRLHQKTGGKRIKEIFPNFSVFVYGGVNFEPYRAQIFDSIGERIPSIETFPASEGFFAYQNDQDDPSLLLLLNSGIFFEFVPPEELEKPQPRRLTIDQIELDTNYALVINNNAGLWGYLIGDMVRFVSKDPYKIVFAGRTKHFISAFGEHVIGQEVERAFAYAMQQHPETRVREFSVAPQVNPPAQMLPHHEWLIAFETLPHDLNAFAADLDQQMCAQNIYYRDLITGKILQPLRVRPLQADAFARYMKSLGKLGGQNKVPRLSDNRDIAEQVLTWAR
ncbi:MAG: GH3 auxin-responsive promoter family protein [Bernardetiaceae bacterium]